MYTIYVCACVYVCGVCVLRGRFISSVLEWMMVVVMMLMTLLIVKVLGVGMLVKEIIFGPVCLCVCLCVCE